MVAGAEEEKTGVERRRGGEQQQVIKRGMLIHSLRSAQGDF